MKHLVLFTILYLLRSGTAFSADINPKTKQSTSVASEKSAAKLPKKKKLTKGIQCEAMTAKGTQCTRSAQQGSRFCWQHDPKGTNASKKAATLKKS